MPNETERSSGPPVRFCQSRAAAPARLRSNRDGFQWRPLCRGAARKCTSAAAVRPRASSIASDPLSQSASWVPDTYIMPMCGAAKTWRAVPSPAAIVFPHELQRRAYVALDGTSRPHMPVYFLGNDPGPAETVRPSCRARSGVTSTPLFRSA